jgi:hypothetical protein
MAKNRDKSGHFNNFPAQAARKLTKSGQILWISYTRTKSGQFPQVSQIRDNVPNIGTTKSNASIKVILHTLWQLLRFLPQRQQLIINVSDFLKKLWNPFTLWKGCPTHHRGLIRFCISDRYLSTKSFWRIGIRLACIKIILNALKELPNSSSWFNQVRNFRNEICQPQDRNDHVRYDLA